MSARDTVITLEDILQRAIQLERDAESLYRRWSEAFAAYPPIALLWQEYAEEETYHARLLEEILARFPMEQRRQPADQEMIETMRRAQAVLKRSSLQPATLSEALEIASEVENSEINAVLELLVERFAPEVTREMIHAQLQEHITKMDEHMRSLEKTTLGLKANWR